MAFKWKVAIKGGKSAGSPFDTLPRREYVVYGAVNDRSGARQKAMELYMKEVREALISDGEIETDEDATGVTFSRPRSERVK